MRPELGRLARLRLHCETENQSGYRSHPASGSKVGHFDRHKWDITTGGNTSARLLCSNERLKAPEGRACLPMPYVRGVRRGSRALVPASATWLGRQDLCHMSPAEVVKRIATIGYENATVRGFLDVLRNAGVDLLVDVRAVARSRRPGFAKTRLAANLQEAGIEYLHLPGLGTPAEGRAAARAGDTAQMQSIFREHLKTPAAEAALDALIALVQSDRNVCILCLEAEPEQCHRRLVADAVAARSGVGIEHLRVEE